MSQQPRRGISEILRLVSSIPDPKNRQDSLATCATINPVITILKFMFDPNIEFDLPEGSPPFKKLEKSADVQGSLYKEARTLYMFVKGQHPNLPDMKRQTMFVQLLESIDPDDAELVLAMKEKKSPYKNITYDLVHKTFPGLLPDPNDLLVLTEQVQDAETEEDGLSDSVTKSHQKDRSKAKPCPFGCVSSAEDGLYLPGPLARHLQIHV